MKDIRIKIAFFLIMTLLLIGNLSHASDTYPTVITEAADFRLETIDGEEIVLSDILNKRKAVLLFWATWCFYCRREMPRVEKFYQKNKDKIAVIGINVGESKRKAERFIRKMGISYPIALDPDLKVSRLYNVLGVPTIVVVDKAGKVIYYGYSVQEMLKKIDF